jgi:hypothetical protein
MNNPYSDTENVVDLMVKAALVDDVETSIRRGHYHGSIEVVMRKDCERASFLVDMSCTGVTPHHLLFKMMKSNLKRILFGVYDKIGEGGGEDG